MDHYSQLESLRIATSEVIFNTTLQYYEVTFSGFKKSKCFMA